ncbi:TATA-binding protein-associated factor 172-like isoform X2 [Oscarella lobularis]|uniref:TATA-binding protein-associated factor 172-like isoform X2 n=1 Tax=Oscarella lobularis TaxID=121494 RepID=UPI003313E79E
MTSRLDRLFLLLDSGSTATTRKAAAESIGEVQKLHPHDLPNLLQKVLVYVKSDAWDTRIAAGQAIEAIARNAPPWEPDKDNSIKDHGFDVHADDRLSLSAFDVTQVLENGVPLLGSSGQEYNVDLDAEAANLPPSERASRQRKLLLKRLGLDSATSGMEASNLIEDDDLLLCPSKPTLASAQKEPGWLPDMSAREKNRAKRLAKRSAKMRPKDIQSGLGGSGSSIEGLGDFNNKPSELDVNLSKKAKIEDESGEMFATDDSQMTTTATTENEWPFEWFCEELCRGLFNSNWTIRHGSATGLREIMKLHAKGGGTARGMTADEVKSFNAVWIEDVALRLVCLLALDRFGDYVSDEVVAPVRETCAQALGVLLKHVESSQARAILAVLLKLLSQRQWQVRHGGLLGIKYLLAVRQDMTKEILPLVLPAIMNGLVDADDDVRAVSSAALLPVADQLADTVPQEVPSLLSSLWDILVDLDELSASTNSVMALLSSLLSTSAESRRRRDDDIEIDGLIPRLWRFLRHAIPSVRKSTCNTLDTLISTASLRPPQPSSTRRSWIDSLCSDLMQHLYHRLAFESSAELRRITLRVWNKLVSTAERSCLEATASLCIRTWLTIAVYPGGMFPDASLLAIMEVGRQGSGLQPMSSTSISRRPQHALQTNDLMLGGANGADDPATVQRLAITARLDMAKALGFFAASLFDTGLFRQIVQCLLDLLKSKSVTQQMVSALVIAELASVCLQKALTCPSDISDGLIAALNASCLFDEHTFMFSRLQTDGQSLLTAFLEKGINLLPQFQSGFTLELATSLATSTYSAAVNTLQVPTDLKSLEVVRSRLLSTINQFQAQYRQDTVRVNASLASALTVLKTLPQKLNPVIRPLMESVKIETNPDLQRCTCTALAELLDQCCERSPCPNPKILKNLTGFLCASPDVTPNASNPVPVLARGEAAGELPSTPTTPDVFDDGPDFLSSGKALSGGAGDATGCTERYGIVTLVKHRQQAYLTSSSRKYATALRKERLSTAFTSVGGGEDEEKLIVQYKGARLALLEIATHFGSNVPSSLPKLWESFESGLQDSLESLQDSSQAQLLVNTLQIIEAVTPSLHKDLHSQLINLLSPLCSCISCPFTAVRHLAARCFSAFASVVPKEALEVIVTQVIQLMSDGDRVEARQGATETVTVLIDRLGVGILSYAVFLVVPLLGRMSDQDEHTRAIAAQTFAKVIQIIPLEAGLPDPPGMSESLVEQKKHERKFLEQLLNPKLLCEYEVSVPIKAELRQYQQNGVNWLAFLNRYNLHGVLCDDMGLGKTLQSICILASDHYKRDEKFKGSGDSEAEPIPSLVVCPPTLTGHWCYETEKFCSPEYLSPLHYAGGPAERNRLWQQLHQYNLVIASYDIVRNDIENFRSINWNYLILDEGHVIKNGKTKMSRAIKSLKANHRLILTGTPIQNNVLELWSLFDFLMPGFLGTEREFVANYSKPILQSRDAKSSSKEQEAGVLAMENLHRQVLPFMLRRLKEDVLQDLPPKIIQDYYCDLSPLQYWLYEDFAKSRANKSVQSSLNKDESAESDDAQGSTHIFQALQYLRKVCNHPLLVLTPQHPLREEVMAKLAQQKSSLHSTSHAAKLVALKQLLLDCGIGLIAGESSSGGSVVGQHRALIFCQLKSMLDIVEHDLLKTEMPSVTYLRLDGSTPAGSRHSVVQRFNADPSFDLLLLTTHVGGLGLNLTGADTVIFVEHDWNPMKDLQAMDRAHRIGQKKVVNVYRLITKGTLEEKVMGLQKFKLNIANTVLTHDNSSLQTMETGELLDLFNVAKSSGSGTRASDKPKGKETLKSLLEKMGDLWDEEQYENEYDLSSFMKSL